jgi:hypothetical protein
MPASDRLVAGGDGTRTRPDTRVSATSEPTGDLRRWTERLRRVALRFLGSPWLFVLIAAVGPFYWGRPWGDFLYGQDSTRLLQPFTFNDSPMIPYSYLDSSTFPVPDFTPYFYIDGTLRVLSDLAVPSWVSERLLLCLFAGLAAAGAVVLCRTIDSVRDRPSVSRAWVLGLVALAYVYNPFTLSITFWHVEGWTLFLAFLPWLATLALRVAHGRTVPIRFAIFVTLLGIYLAPGTISSFAVPVSVVLLWGIVAVWLVRSGRPFRWKDRLLRSTVLVGVVLGIEGWSFVPFLLVPNIAYTSNNYVTPANLVAVYTEVAATSTPFAVLTLTAFSWLARTPSAYGWFALFPLVAAAAVVFPLLAILGAGRLRRSPGALLVYAMGLTVLPLMIGGVAPLTGLDIDLLHLGGPFLVLAGAYYFLGTLYVLLTVVGLHELLHRPTVATPEGDEPEPRGRLRPAWSAAVRAVRRPSGILTVAIVALLLVAALPFATGDVDQTQGPNANVVPIPPSYSTMERYFGTPASGPDYYVLVLPMSDQSGAYLNVSGRQYLDTGNLLSSFIPYPVLETNNGPTAAALEDLFAAGPPANLAAVLANAHIRYVVDNPFANRTSPAMNRAPDGGAVNYTALLAALAGAVGPGTSVGPFLVFGVAGAIPLGWSTSELVGVNTTSDAGTLALVGGVTSGPPGWVAALRGALWSPNGTLPGWTLRPTAVTTPSAFASVRSGESLGIVDRSGRWTSPPCATGNCTANGTEFDWSATGMTVEGQLERNLSSPGEYVTDQPSSAEGYCSTSSQSVYLAANGTVSGPAFLTANVSLVSPGVNNWASIQLTSGNVSLLLQTYQDSPAHLAALALSALANGVPYAWHNSLLPQLLPNGAAWTMSLGWNATTADAEIAAGNASASTSLAFGNLVADAVNPGFNPAAAPRSPVAITNATENVSMVGAALCLHATAVARLPDVAFLVAEGPEGPSNDSIGTNGSVSSSGDVVVDSGASRFVVLGYPYDPLWTASGASGVGLSQVAGAPFANVFAVLGPGPGAVVTFHFRTWIIVGLEASWFEVTGLVAVGVLLTYRARRAGAATAAPSTTDAPGTERSRDRSP